jgi:hypothetical protein
MKKTLKISLALSLFMIASLLSAGKTMAKASKKTETGKIIVRNIIRK